MISNTPKAEILSSAGLDPKSIVLVKTRDGTSTLTVGQVKNFDSVFFDGWLECARPNKDGHLELMLPVNTKVWKRAVTCMEAKKYDAPPAWVGDSILPDMLEEQLSFYAPRPYTEAIGRAEALKMAARAIPKDFVRIKAGDFLMHSPAGGAEHLNVTPPCWVRLSQDFWYQATPVTQGQWQSLMGNNPSHFHTDGPDGELASKRPVERVNWYEAAAYCNALSVKAGLPPYYDLISSAGTPGTASWVNPSQVLKLASGVNSYRLPSEAEQQRARQGSDASTLNQATYTPAGASLGDIAWYGANAGNRTHPVGLLLPTNEGVHDALGNVYEWSNDWYSQHPTHQMPTHAYTEHAGTLPLPNGGLIDPTGPATGHGRVVGGGSWGTPALQLRAADRFFGEPLCWRNEATGFRPARFASPDSKSLERR